MNNEHYIHIRDDGTINMSWYKGKTVVFVNKDVQLEVNKLLFPLKFKIWQEEG